MSPPDVALRRVRLADFGWLTRIGLRREFVGVQYSWFELPLQALIAPLRALLGPFVPACVVLIDGSRAGYVGRSPLSGNLEYFICGWGQGRGAGRRAIAEFLAHHRVGDRRRKFIVRKHNKRSIHVLRGVFDELDWVEGKDYHVRQRMLVNVVEIPAG